MRTADFSVKGVWLLLSRSMSRSISGTVFPQKHLTTVWFEELAIRFLYREHRGCDAFSKQGAKVGLHPKAFLPQSFAYLPEATLKLFGIILELLSDFLHFFCFFVTALIAHTVQGFVVVPPFSLLERQLRARFDLQNKFFIQGFDCARSLILPCQMWLTGRNYRMCLSTKVHYTL